MVCRTSRFRLVASAATNYRGSNASHLFVENRPINPPLPIDVLASTRAWIERAVIGLNLCPFAKAVYVRDQIHYVVSAAREPATLLAELERELRDLAAADATKVDTTLLIHPHVLTDFLDYNEFLGDADDAVERLGFTGVFQIASFHPDYQFSGVPADDVSNFTNRSPFPMLHILREVSVTRAVDATSDPDEIHRRNVETMRRLGVGGLKALGLTPPDIA
jgi:uncharacterized protein